MTDQDIEKMIQEEGATTGPRLNLDRINNTIVDTYYHRVPGTTLTICVLTLKNGYQVVGESASVSKENFREKIGRQIAFEKARDKVWALEGYLLKQKEYEKEYEKENQK